MQLDFAGFASENEMTEYFFQNSKSMLIIGATDGIFCENYYPFYLKYGMAITDAVLVEAAPWHYKKLQQNFPQFPHWKFENSAITNFNGESDFVGADPELNGQYPDWMNGCGMLGTQFQTERGETNLLNLSDKDVTQYKKIVKVNCMTVDTLLQKYNLEQIDIIKTDTEGHDWIILQQMNLDKIRPKIYTLETLHAKDSTVNEMRLFFENYGYSFHIIGYYDPSWVGLTGVPQRSATACAIRKDK